MEDPDKSKKDFSTAVKYLQENILASIDFEKYNAKMRKVRYDALIAEGFTKNEALLLCVK